MPSTRYVKMFTSSYSKNLRRICYKKDQAFFILERKRISWKKLYYIYNISQVPFAKVYSKIFAILFCLAEVSSFEVLYLFYVFHTQVLQNYNQARNVSVQWLEQSLKAEVKSRITGCKAQMSSFRFFYGLNLSFKIYSITDNLSKTLQAERLWSNTAFGILAQSVNDHQTIQWSHYFELQ